MSESLNRSNDEGLAIQLGQLAGADVYAAQDPEHKLGVPIDDIEIERRFLVPRGMLPYVTVEANKVERIRQGYFRDAAGVKYRVRETIDDATGEATYMVNRKIRTGESRLRRGEPKIYITREQFDELWPLAEKRSLAKTRWHLPWRKNQEQELQIEIDDWGDPDWVIAEIEFASEEEARDPNLELPNWFGLEVTEDKRWGNASLAKHGAPRVDPVATI